MRVGRVSLASLVSLDAAAFHPDVVCELVLREARFAAVVGDVVA